MSKGALDSVRVISLGSVWAGPYVGRVLAECGAEVIRIALSTRVSRSIPNQEGQIAWKESLVAKGMPKDEAERITTFVPTYSGPYQNNNYSLGLDIRNTKGKELYKELVRITDVILDGWSPRVMSGQKLGYSVLKEVKPGIIYVSIPALGMTGPAKDVRMFGLGCSALGGLTSIRGYPGEQPYPSSAHVADPISAMHILSAILAALNYRDETGKGQHLDISQTEIATVVIGEALMDYSMNKRVAGPQGNHHPNFAPHGCYRCKGDDMWVTIAVTSEDEWYRFCMAVDFPEWLTDPRFTDLLSRWQNHEELDRLIEGWTSRHDHYVIQEMLQQSGVRAAAVITLEEQLYRDPHVKDRDVYQWITYHDGKADPIFRAPWVFSKTPTVMDQPSPYIGQHNDYILGEVLGMSKDDINQLVEEQVVGAAPPIGGALS